MKTVYKNSPPSHLMRASSTRNYELKTDHLINFSHSIDCVIIVQPHLHESRNLKNELKGACRGEANPRKLNESQSTVTANYLS